MEKKFLIWLEYVFKIVELLHSALVVFNTWWYVKQDENMILIPFQSFFL